MLNGLQILALSLGLLACVNTTYSRKEEKQITNKLIHLITGQFPHHGKAFYEDQLEKMKARLAEKPDDVEARNDRAVAYLKLKRYDEAKAEFDRIEAQAPGRYRTQANLGVMYKKLGEYDKAAEHIAKSLAIKPEGHLGLGDYYVRMARWLKTAQKNQEAVKENFLGISYGLPPEQAAANALVNREYILTLIKADRTFADALVVLGDILYTENEHQLAIRAYHRAKYLHHPAPDAINRRIDLIYRRWQEQVKTRDGHIVEPARMVSLGLTAEFLNAKQWVASFEKTEAELIAAGKPVDYALVEAEMERQGIRHPAIMETGLVEGAANTPWMGNGLSFKSIFLLGAIALFAFVVAVKIYRAVASPAKRAAHA